MSKEQFQLWKETPWFNQFLKEKIKEADEEVNVLAKTILICPSQEIENRRMITAGTAGQSTALQALIDLRYEDVVGDDDE